MLFSSFPRLNEVCGRIREAYIFFDGGYIDINTFPSVLEVTVSSKFRAELNQCLGTERTVTQREKHPWKSVLFSNLCVILQTSGMWPFFSMACFIKERLEFGVYFQGQ